jgi:hypothetical protein
MTIALRGTQRRRARETFAAEGAVVTASLVSLPARAAAPVMWSRARP